MNSSPPASVDALFANHNFRLCLTLTKWRYAVNNKLPYRFVMNVFLSQLAVFAASAVDLRMGYGLIARRLTIHTSSNAGQCRAAAFGYRVAAIVAIFGAGACWHPGSRPRHRILDAVVDLILYRAIACPAACHDAAFLPVGRFQSGPIVSNPPGTKRFRQRKLRVPSFVRHVHYRPAIARKSPPCCPPPAMAGHRLCRSGSGHSRQIEAKRRSMQPRDNSRRVSGVR